MMEPDEFDLNDKNNEPDLDNKNKDNKSDLINQVLQKDLNLSALKKEREFYHQDSNNDDMEEDNHSSSPENEQDSQKEENNPYRPYRLKSEQWLQDRIKRISKDIEDHNKEDDHLTDEIRRIKEQLRLITYNADQRSLNRQLEKNLAERDVYRQELEDFHNQLDEIRKELERRKKDGNESAEHIYSVSVQSLFLENEPIENTVLYVATFFAALSLSDFKRVVSTFLVGRTVSITKSQTVTEDGKSKIIETQEEQSLVKKWEESVQEPNQADKTLKKCSLKVCRTEDSLVVDFLVPYLRIEFIQYFHEEQAFYIEEQYKRVQELLFDFSAHVANSAINLLAEAPIYYPNNYGATWLLDVTAVAEDLKSELFFERISKLIFQMQIILDTEQSQRILKRFLNALLEQEKNYVFKIVLDLIHKQLRFNFLPNKIDSLKQLLDWLKQVLDQGKKEQKPEAYNVLERLLEKRDSHEYIYDILGILKAWLPEPERPLENYSPSNQAALLLLVSYCKETIERLPIENYGCWPSKYPLFKSMRNDLDIDSSLNLVISWLFQPSVNQGLAINSVFPDTMKAIQFIGFMIAEWFTILYGLQEDKPKPEASKLADSLLRQVIIVAERSEKKRLTEFWALLANIYLEKATTISAQSAANKKSKREFVYRRKLIKELRNRFKALQQEILTVG